MEPDPSFTNAIRVALVMAAAFFVAMALLSPALNGFWDRRIPWRAHVTAHRLTLRDYMATKAIDKNPGVRNAQDWRNLGDCWTDSTAAGDADHVPVLRLAADAWRRASRLTGRADDVRKWGHAVSRVADATGDDRDHQRARRAWTTAGEACSDAYQKEIAASMARRHEAAPDAAAPAQTA